MESNKSQSSSFAWATIEVGQELVLLEAGCRQFSGRVDAVTQERDVIWLTSAAGERRLFHVADGYTPSLLP
jgi:hypothetical protein